MDASSHARAVLARMNAQSFGRPVPQGDVIAALEQEGVPRDVAEGCVRGLVPARHAREVAGGLLPASASLASRAPSGIASFASLHR